MRSASVAAFFFVAVACSQAGAAEKQTLYDRAQVSVGALSSGASVVAVARVLTRVDTGDSTVFTIAILSSLKGEPSSELTVTTPAGSRLLDGEHLAFLDRTTDGTWTLRGGTDFGWVRLVEGSRDLALRTAAAHCASDPDEMAAAASAALPGSDARLAGDAAVDLFNMPAMVPMLDAAAKKAVAQLVGTASGRAFIPGEWHYLAVTAGRLGDPACVSALISAASDPSCLPRAFAIGKAFSLVGETGRAALLDAFEASEDEAALPGLMAACAQAKLGAALPKILSLADSGGERVRKFALVAAGDIGGPAAIAFLKAALSDERRPVVERKLAVIALAAGLDPDGIKAIVDADKALPEGELAKFVRAFRKDPAAERLNLLRSALRGE